MLLSDSKNSEERLIPWRTELEILYEDDNLIAVNMPSGMVCHPSKGHACDSLANALRGYFDEQDPYACVYLLGRLDKDGSGIVLTANLPEDFRGTCPKAADKCREGKILSQ